ncbi:MAG: hypothetical protein M3081_04770 [Gemmatimonadota bacterium]|nr:hypothetical protein [Gemmatimonadota bacterium]
MSDAAAASEPIPHRTSQPVAIGAQASIGHLLGPKLLTARARATKGQRKRRGRWVLLGGTALIFWAGILKVLTSLLSYFRGVPEIGALLAGKLLGMIFISFFSILLLSNVITALSSFFLARDLDMLVSGPVDWLTLYLAKLAETVVHSSWMVTLMAVPLFAAYGIVYEGGWLFALEAAATFIPFLIIPAVIGSAVTITLVNVFPARRTRDILSVIAVLAAGGLVLLFRLLRPEKLVHPDEVRSLVGFIALLRTPTSPWLPSEWVQRGVMSALVDQIDGLPYYLLWTTAAAFVVGGALLHRSLYARGFTKAQESSGQWARRRASGGIVYAMLAPLGALRRELVIKEIRLFFRDSTQWSQLILLAVLVVVYVFNIKFLPLTGVGVSQVLVDIVPFVNLAVSGFVLSSISARFIFPAVSLEGRTLWLLRSSPMPMKTLLWAKYWTGTLPLLTLALLIVFVTDSLLKVSPFMMLVSVFSIAFMTFAIAGLALGFGALFPQYETENAAQIPTSFGGLVFMMTSIALIAGVVILEARPVISYICVQNRMPSCRVADAGTMDLLIGFGGAALLCLLATFVPPAVALRKLEKGE